MHYTFSNSALLDPLTPVVLTNLFWRLPIINYYPETDSLYIDLSEKTSVESKEISEGVVLDYYDTEGNLVGIDTDNTSTKVQLKELIRSRLPSDIHTVAA